MYLLVAKQLELETYRTDGTQSINAGEITSKDSSYSRSLQFIVFLYQDRTF